ncbi:MAG TPA: YraN family protein [Solirubrobacterales bacterium]|jgi:putative endonuclease|nr:YraN family protein [Solirubrobacterales bacterium]
MTKARLRTGRIGEDLACRRLERDGLMIVARNSRTRFGELDVIAIDGETLVFVEVKTTRAGGLRGPEQPAHAVGRRKQMQVRRLARAWLAENLPPRYRSIRFDVVGVSLDAGGGSVVEHLPGAF